MDAAHAFHARAHVWWAANAPAGWASCPLTENGLVRIMSNPSYSRMTRFTPATLVTTLQSFVAQTNHEFWPDSLSLRDTNFFDTGYIHSFRRITDIYLLGLAMHYGGCLATFDQAVPHLPLKASASTHLCVI